MSKKLSDYELDSDASAEGQAITAILPEGHDPDDLDSIDDDDLPELLGHAVFYTVGDMAVEREWMVNRMDQLGLPAWMVPNKVTPKRAFNRVADRLVDDTRGNNIYTVENGLDMTVYTRQPISDEIHLRGEIYVPSKNEAGENITEDDDGRIKDVDLGVFHYKDKAVVPDCKLNKVGNMDNPDQIYKVWEHYKAQARSLYQDMQEQHIGRDIQKMLYRFTHDWTRSVKLRDGGAVYFIPARHSETTEKVKMLVTEMGELFKDRGRAAEVQKIPVLDTEEQNYMVEQRARIAVEERIDSALEDFFEELGEQEDVLVSDLQGVLRDALEDVEDLESEYNTLLQAEISARRVVEDWLNSADTPDNEARNAIEEVADAALGNE